MTSRYWSAHLKATSARGDRPGIQEEGNTSISVISNYSRPREEEGQVLAKKARTALHSSKHVRTCKEQCPTVWTIDKYCPNCHG